MKKAFGDRHIALIALLLASFLFGIQREAVLIPKTEGEEERSIVGAWITGEDIDIVYSFCEDGTFTHWNTIYYFKKGQKVETSTEKIGCGTYGIGKDEISNTIDLHFQDENACVALGRFGWSSDPVGELTLNIAECGEPRPDSPYYYSMRSGGNLDCTCVCKVEDIQMTELSGRFGYGLTGAYDFTGSLTKETLTDAAWHLDGQFTFPTAGYSVEIPTAIVLESYPEQVSVTIEVTRPAPDSIVAQVITPMPVSLDITVSNEALFTMRTRVCDGDGVSEGEGELVEGEGETVEGEGEENLMAIAKELSGIFDTADTNGDDKIDYSEASSSLSGLISQSQFDMLDSNDDGYLTQEELDAYAGVDDCCCGRITDASKSVLDWLGDGLLLGLAMMILVSMTRHQHH